MKKILAIFLALIMCLGATGAFATGGRFTDVKTSDWFYNDVQNAVELGLVNGKSETTFEPNSKLTYAEAIKLAACMHQLYTTDEISIKAGNPWYAPYVEYCEENNIINKTYTFSENATRAGYMEIFANALPGDGLKAINYVQDDSIPDVPSSKNYAAGVYKLYRAGILQGVDAEHNCSPLNSITRSEVAAILTRMMDENKRIKFTLGEEPVEPLTFTKEPIGGSLDVGGTIITSVVVEGGVSPYAYQWEYNDGSGWKAVTAALGKISGEETAKVSIKADAAASYEVRCVVKDSKGNKAVSEETAFVFKAKEDNKLKIAEEPESATAEAGKPLFISVKVTGGTEPYTYHWVTDAGESWFSLINARGVTGADTEKLIVTTTAATTVTVRCIVKDSKGAKVESKIVDLVFTEPVQEELVEEEPVEEEPTAPLTITKQPQDTNVDLDETAVLEVEVAGGKPDYTYQWFYQGGNNWNMLTDTERIAGTNSPKLSITSSTSLSVNLFCEVRDAKGNKVNSEKANLFIGTKVLPLEIETQPVDTTVSVGTDAVIKVKAINGVGDYTYRWQMNIGPSWVRISDNDMIIGTETDTLTLKATAASYIDVRCLVSDATNNSVASQGVRVTFE